MRLICAACGHEIAFGNSIDDGCDVDCPNCGATTIYRKPTRIEVPIGAKRVEDGSSSAAQAEDNRRPKLRVIRPQSMPPTHSAPIATPVRPADRPVPNLPSPKRSLGKSDGISVWLMLLLMLCVGYFVWSICFSEDEQFASTSEQQESSGQDLQRMRAEEDRRLQRQEEQRKAEEERRLRRQEEQRRAEEDRQRKKAQEMVLRERRDILDRVRSVKLDYWQNCPTDQRPQAVKVERTYSCIVPKGGDRAEVFKLVAVPEKDLVVERYDETGERTPIAPDEFNAILKVSVHLIVENEKGWICGTQKNVDGIPIANANASINPSQEELGMLYEFFRARSMGRSSVNYGVFFGGEDGVCKLVRRVGFGESVSAGDVKRLILEDLRKRGNGLTGRSAELKAEAILISGRFYYSSDSIEIASGFFVAKGGVAALKRKISENLKEIKRLQRENPACEWNQESGSNIINVKLRRRTKEQFRYYAGEVTYVRKHFYCSGCDREHDGGHCRSSLTAYPNWRNAREKIDVTLKFNERIDELWGENELLTKYLEKLESSKKTQ